MIFNVQKIIVGALPLAIMFIGLEWVADLITFNSFVYRGCTFILVSWLVGHIMTVWTNFYRSAKHGR